MNLAAGTGSLGAHLRDKEQPQAHCQDSEGKFLSSGEPGRGSGVCSVRSEKQRECQMPMERGTSPSPGIPGRAEVEGAGGKLLILQGKFIRHLQGSENTGWYGLVRQVGYPHVHSREERLGCCKWKPDP